MVKYLFLRQKKKNYFENKTPSISKPNIAVSIDVRFQNYTWIFKKKFDLETQTRSSNLNSIFESKLNPKI